MCYVQKYGLRKKTKDIFVKAFNRITNKNKAKAMTEHISCDYKCKFNSTICNSNQKWNYKTCQCKCKKCRTCKKHYSWNPSKSTCDNSKYLKNTSMTECDKNFNCYGYCIYKKDYSNQCREYCFNRFS